jgi:hypothetical protein
MKTLRVSLIILIFVTGCKREDAPTVKTTDVLSVTRTSATCGGEVTSQGSFEVISRGICWSTSSNPTIQDSITFDGSGLGSYTSSIVGLNPGTEYFVRAYATNNTGTGYGETKSFTTDPASLPEVKTSPYIGVSQTTASFVGYLVSDCSSEVFDRGFCWSTSEDSDLSDNHVSVSLSSYDFFTKITGLDPNTEYFVSAYATNLIGTGYGNPESFTTCPEMDTASIVGTWQLILHPENCAIILIDKRIEITSDSVFTQYTDGIMDYTSTFSLRTYSEEEGIDSILFHNPEAQYNYQFIRLLNCNNLSLDAPVLTIDAVCSYYKRIK